MTVDQALAEARVQVSVSYLKSLEWATPVLYMRSPDGVLFSRPQSTTPPAATDSSAPLTVTAQEETAAQRAQGQENGVALRQVLVTHFNDGELRDLCFDLGIDYEHLPGQTKGDKARELVAYVQRRGRTAELVALCRRLRPGADWQSVNQIGQPERASGTTINQTGGVNFGSGNTINHIGDIVGGDKISGDKVMGDKFVVGDWTQHGQGSSDQSLKSQLQEQLTALRRRLHQRELQKARYGISADPSILIEIEDLKQEIAQVRAQLDPLG